MSLRSVSRPRLYGPLFFVSRLFTIAACSVLLLLLLVVVWVFPRFGFGRFEPVNDADRNESATAVGDGSYRWWREAVMVVVSEEEEEEEDGEEEASEVEFAFGVWLG